MAENREALMAAYQALVKERDEMNGAISFLARRLGIDQDQSIQDEAGRPPAIPTEGLKRADADVTTMVRPGEFFGKNSTQAARIVLERAGSSHPLPTRAILAAITKGGVRLTGRTPENTLYRSMDRDDESFFRPARGVWGLTEWYPERARRAREGKRNGEGPGGTTAAAEEVDSGSEA